jgi:anti-sigma factor RsiW
MTCHETRAFLNAWLDDELDVSGALSLEQHMADCADCQRAREQAEALRAALRQPELRYQPAPDFTRRLHQSLQDATPRPRPVYAMWLAAAAVLVVLLGGLYLGRQSGQNSIAAQVLASHIRSLQVGHLTDVLSSDHHTVKPWFQGKLDFSPPVPDPPSADWTLVGGRLDYLDSRPVAALVYARGRHTVNVFVWPADGGSAHPATVQGYNILHFTRHGMTWWVVSDLNLPELSAFAQGLK